MLAPVRRCVRFVDASGGMRGIGRKKPTLERRVGCAGISAQESIGAKRQTREIK